MLALKRILLVLAGIFVGQMILYGPSLVGAKILLPLDLLATPNIYLPQDEQTKKIVVEDRVRSDLVYSLAVYREFAVQEARAGRLPCWAPYQYTGSVLMLQRFSPFLLPCYCFGSPVAIAWEQMLLAMVAGLGFYLFCRNNLAVGYWPATLTAWCYPMTGFFIFWQGFPPIGCIVWLPWILMAVDKMVRRPNRWGGVGLASATCLILISGQLDIAAQVLLTSGLYATWCFLDEYGKECLSPRIVPAMAAVTAAWILGGLLALPQLLPMLEYTRTGARLADRSQGLEERPPIGMAALPEIVMPDMYGSTHYDSCPRFPDRQSNQLESASATYTGLLATLFVAPLAWCSRRHRSINIFWTVLIVLSLSWCLNVPGIVHLLRTPGLNMMSHNRFVFAASFAILAMTAVGLEVLREGNVPWRPWFWGPVAILAILLLYCGYRVVVVPEPIASQIELAISKGRTLWGIGDMETLARVHSNYARSFMAVAFLSVLGIAGWLLFGFRVKWRTCFFPGLAVFLLVDMLWFAYGRSAQCDPALYYPRIPALEALAKAEPGRVIGIRCLPAILSQTHGLNDIRGYDSVDPARMIDLMDLVRHPKIGVIRYARTQWMVPKSIELSPDGARISPLFDMLNVRYLIFRGSPPADIKPDFSSPDYWVMTNKHALPRVFVPESVETVPDDQERLTKLGAKNFDPRKVAFVEKELSLPAKCQGKAEIVDEIPTRIQIRTDMKTAGLVVLSDLWNQGWNAYLNGKSVPIVRTNHAIRGVEIPEGSGSLEFRYEPASFSMGLKLCGLALVLLTVWTWCGNAWLFQRIRRESRQPSSLDSTINAPRNLGE